MTCKAKIRNISFFSQIPNDLFDKLPAIIGKDPCWVLSHIVRLTTGFHKDKTEISLNRLAERCAMSRTHVKECIQVLLEHNLITKVVRPGKTSVYIFDVIDSEDLEKPDDMPCADPVATRPTEPSTRSPHDLHPVATRPTTRSPRDHVKDIYIINKNLKERERDAPPLTPFEQVSQNLIDDYTTEVIRMRLMNQYPTLRGNEPMILDETEARVRNIWRVEFDKGNPSAKSQGYGSKLALTVWLDVARDYTRGKSKKDNGNNTLEDKLALLRTGR